MPRRQVFESRTVATASGRLRKDHAEWMLTTQVGDLTLAIPRLRNGSFFPQLARAMPPGR
jgi:transposase-like protein